MIPLKAIADGAPFDTTETIRLICQYLVDANPFPLNPDRLPDLDTPIDNRDQETYSTDEHPFALLLNQRLAGILIANGYHTPADITTSTDEELLALDGLGEKTLTLIRKKFPYYES